VYSQACHIRSKFAFQNIFSFGDVLFQNYFSFEKQHQLIHSQMFKKQVIILVWIMQYTKKDALVSTLYHSLSHYFHQHCHCLKDGDIKEKEGTCRFSLVDIQRCEEVCH